MGRADRIAKIEGIRVSLSEFDARLVELKGVSQAAVVVLGTDTPYLGGIVVLDAIGKTELASRGAFRLGRRLRARSFRDTAVRGLAAPLAFRSSVADRAARQGQAPPTLRPCSTSRRQRRRR